MSKNQLITGLLLGTFFAMLFAPQKGKILRETMEKKGLEPLMKGFIALFNEAYREIEKYNVETAGDVEKNPFTITKI